MATWLSLEESVIDLDLVQSFHISNQQIIFHFNNHKVDWNFDNNEEAQKVFTSLQKKINADISHTKEFTEAIEKIKAKIIKIEPDSTIKIENKEITIVLPTFDKPFDKLRTCITRIKNDINPLCKEIDYQLFTDILKTTQKWHS
jgi:hypothetical protein